MEPFQENMNKKLMSGTYFSNLLELDGVWLRRCWWSAAIHHGFVIRGQLDLHLEKICASCSKDGQVDVFKELSLKVAATPLRK